ncbi:unnamed protein product, partial [Owenia fusiformis]
MSNIKVAVRVRPLTKREKENKSRIIVKINGDTLSIQNVKLDGQLAEYGDSRERVKLFTFDYAYWSVSPTDSHYVSQPQIFQDLGTEVLEAAFEGYNACVFAYGQTGTGKTHTMMGYPGDIGLIPRLSEGLFSRMDDITDESVSYRIDVSYLELYNERVRDLLPTGAAKTSQKYTLKVREHPQDGPYVQDLSHHLVKQNETIQDLISQGNYNRATAATHIHDHSSRSHAIFTINFTQAKIDTDLPSEIVSKIHLVDLAGSERADSSASYDKGRLKEGANINKSLVTLGTVIKSLAEKSLLSWSSETSMGSTLSLRSTSTDEQRPPSVVTSPSGTPRKQRQVFIPYRDSVLTWLLKDSLGGNAKSIMISTISPASEQYRESISTLRYAQRAKSIINRPTINEDHNITLIKELKGEIEHLKAMLSSVKLQKSPQTCDMIYLVPNLEMKSNSSAGVQVKKAGSVISLQSDCGSLTGSMIAERLEENEAKAKALTEGWINRWQEAQDVMQESNMTIRSLRQRSSSLGVIVDSSLPHLIGMDDDILSTGVVMYNLKEGTTRMGGGDAVHEPDIVVHGPDVEPKHCVIKNQDNEVTIRPCPGAYLVVNGVEVTEPTRLSQGDVILIGRTNMFRFNNPQEALKLREHRMSTGGDARMPGALSRCSSASSINTLNTSSGIDMDTPASPTNFSPLMFFNPVLELERQYKTETERIEQARRELQKLHDEQREAEDARQDKEEEMWRKHEEHKAELDRQKRHMQALMEEHEHAKAAMAQELEQMRAQIEEEKQINAGFIAAQLRQLSLLKDDTRNWSSLGIQTDGDFSGDGACDVINVNVECEPVESEVIEKDAIRRRKTSVQGQKKSLVQLELLHRHSHKEAIRRVTHRQRECEERISSHGERIKVQKHKLHKIEKEYKKEDVKDLEHISADMERTQMLRKREQQLGLYVRHKANQLQRRGSPVGRSGSSDTSSNHSDPRSTSVSPDRASSLGSGPKPKHNASPLLKTTTTTTVTFSRKNSQDPSKSNTSGAAKHKDQYPSPQPSPKNKIPKHAQDITSRLYQAPAGKPKFQYLRSKRDVHISDATTREDVAPVKLLKGATIPLERPKSYPSPRIMAGPQSRCKSVSVAGRGRARSRLNTSPGSSPVGSPQRLIQQHNTSSLTSVPESVEHLLEQDYLYEEGDSSDGSYLMDHQNRSESMTEFLDLEASMDTTNPLDSSSPELKHLHESTDGSSPIGDDDDDVDMLVASAPAALTSNVVRLKRSQSDPFEIKKQAQNEKSEYASIPAKSQLSTTQPHIQSKVDSDKPNKQSDNSEHSKCEQHSKSDNEMIPSTAPSRDTKPNGESEAMDIESDDNILSSSDNIIKSNQGAKFFVGSSSEEPELTELEGAEDNDELMDSDAFDSGLVTLGSQELLEQYAQALDRLGSTSELNTSGELGISQQASIEPQLGSSKHGFNNNESFDDNNDKELPDMKLSRLSDTHSISDITAPESEAIPVKNNEPQHEIKDQYDNIISNTSQKSTSQIKPHGSSRNSNIFVSETATFKKRPSTDTYKLGEIKTVKKPSSYGSTKTKIGVNKYKVGDNKAKTSDQTKVSETKLKTRESKVTSYKTKSKMVITRAQNTTDLKGSNKQVSQPVVGSKRKNTSDPSPQHTQAAKIKSHPPNSDILPTDSSSKPKVTKKTLKDVKSGFIRPKKCNLKGADIPVEVYVPAGYLAENQSLERVSTSRHSSDSDASFVRATENTRTMFNESLEDFDNVEVKVRSRLREAKVEAREKKKQEEQARPMKKGTRGKVGKKSKQPLEQYLIIHALPDGRKQTIDEQWPKEGTVSPTPLSASSLVLEKSQSIHLDLDDLSNQLSDTQNICLELDNPNTQVSDALSEDSLNSPKHEVKDPKSAGSLQCESSRLTSSSPGKALYHGISVDSLDHGASSPLGVSSRQVRGISVDSLERVSDFEERGIEGMSVDSFKAGSEGFAGLLSSRQRVQHKGSMERLKEEDPLVQSNLVEFAAALMSEDPVAIITNDTQLNDREKLQLLQFLEVQQLAQKSSDGQLQLSAARKAARLRAKLRQQQLGADSDATGALSDDSLASGKHSKSSSRPGSGSTPVRRRRSTKRNRQKVQHHRKNDSEDYITSDNDSIYSEDSLFNDGLLDSVDLNEGSPQVKVLKTETDPQFQSHVSEQLSGISEAISALTDALNHSSHRNSSLSRKKKGSGTQTSLDVSSDSSQTVMFNMSESAQTVYEASCTGDLNQNDTMEHTDTDIKDTDVQKNASKTNPDKENLGSGNNTTNRTNGNTIDTRLSIDKSYVHGPNTVFVIPEENRSDKADISHSCDNEKTDTHIVEKDTHKDSDNRDFKGHIVSTV